MASVGRPHPPSQARAIVQEAKSGRGRALRELMAEAGAIADPSFAAEALFALSQDPRLNTNQAAAVLDDVLAQAAKVERGWRRAELLELLARRSAKWREGPTAASARSSFVERIMALVLAMPAGQPLSSAIQGVAGAAGTEQLSALLGRALDNAGFEVEDAKAVLKAAATAGSVAPMVARLQTVADPAMQARLLGALHHHLAKHDASHAAAVLGHALASLQRVRDEAVRVEVLRSLVASTESTAGLHSIVAAAGELSAEPRARVLAAAGGRADRLRDPGQARVWLDEGLAGAAAIADLDARAAVEANLRAGLERLAPKAAATPKSEAAALPRAEVARGSAQVSPSSGGTRHVLAVYDTYEGGLKDVHLRAVARAAPLCYAFDLDLALLGFPATDVGSLANAAADETNIGDGGRYLEELSRAGRVHLVACTTKDPPTDWSRLGLPVATTSKPAAGKATDLPGAFNAAKAAGSGRVCLIMGLGKRGLPPSLLRAVNHHLELTGRGVSMETATAMGVMAERLRTLPQP